MTDHSDYYALRISTHKFHDHEVNYFGNIDFRRLAQLFYFVKVPIVTFQEDVEFWLEEPNLNPPLCCK
jgi:hypothetical protein